MRVVALDIDGVLATASSYRRAGFGVDSAPWTVLRRDLAAQVQALCSAADASVVVSSAWRLLFPLDELAGWLADVGLTAPVLGATPHLPGRPRGAEIASWCLDRGIGDQDLVVLEDEEDVRPYRGRWVQTHFGGPDQGFTAGHLRRALRLWGLGPPGRRHG